MAQKIELDGRPVGRLKAGWILFKESWRYLQSDTEIVAIPLIAAILNILFFGVLMAAFFYLVLSGTLSISTEGEPATIAEYFFYFCFYVIGAFTLAISQAGVAHTVYTRAHGGDATLLDSLKVAFVHSGSLFLWALITSTVGLILRIIAERSKIIGRIVVSLVGVAWAVVTYFVVPGIVLGKKSAPAAIGHSAQVFKRTWGETVVTNVSLGVVFLLIYLLVIICFIGLGIFLAATQSGTIITVLIVFFVITLICISLVQSALEGIIKTLLYIYATEGTYPPNFNPELLEKMLARKDGQNPVPLPTPGSTSDPKDADINTDQQSSTPSSIDSKKYVP